MFSGFFSIELQLFLQIDEFVPLLPMKALQSCRRPCDSDWRTRACGGAAVLRAISGTSLGLTAAQ